MASNEGILHRDVSGGNILIYPTVKTIIDKATGKETSVLQWAGRLTDWELSKRLDMLLARQPERTVGHSCEFVVDALQLMLPLDLLGNLAIHVGGDPAEPIQSC